MMALRDIALMRCELKRLAKNPPTYVMVGVSLLLALLTALSSPKEENALLFMVAGDDLKQIGGTVGFIGNIVASDDLIGSAIRTSLVFTIMWIPIVIVYAAHVTARDYAVSASYSVSKARGVSETAMAASKLLVHGSFLVMLYVFTCFAPFAYKAVQYGAVLTPDGVWRFSYISCLSAIVLAVLFAETFALYQLMRSTAVTTVVMVMLSLIVLMWFPSMYAGGSGSLHLAVYLSPVFYLMNICALCFRNVDVLNVVLYVAVASMASLAISLGALKLQERY